MHNIYPYRLLTLLLLIVYIHPITECYQKIKYITVDEKITSIANCKTINNLIYATSSNKLIIWISYNYRQEYNLPTASTHHIQCSRYGSVAQHTYVGVLSGENVTVWEEIIQSSYYSYLNNRQFHAIQHTSAPNYISVGEKYLGVGYRQQYTVDIYNLHDEDNKLLISIPLTGQLICMKMDYFDNLALVLYVNGSYVFQYHLYPEYGVGVHRQQFVLDMDNGTYGNVTMDYQIPQMQQIASEYKVVFLISAPYQAIFINYTAQGRLSNPERVQNNHSEPLQLCDNTKSTNQDTKIWKQTDGDIIELANPITTFVCVKDTGMFIDSFYYVVSYWKDQYYVDCFSVANWKVWLVLGISFVVFCFCGCAYTFGKMANRQKQELWVCINKYFCICPTQQNIQSIQQSLMK